MTLAHSDLSDISNDGSSLAVTLEARTKDSGVVAVISFLAQCSDGRVKGYLRSCREQIGVARSGRGLCFLCCYVHTSVVLAVLGRMVNHGGETRWPMPTPKHGVSCEGGEGDDEGEESKGVGSGWRQSCDPLP